MPQKSSRRERGSTSFDPATTHLDPPFGLSNAYHRESAYVAVHQYHRTPHRTYFAAAEAIVTSVGGRPHWGKLHSLDAESLRELYPRFDDFEAMRAKLDPTGRFSNSYLDRVLG